MLFIVVSGVPIWNGTEGDAHCYKIRLTHYTLSSPTRNARAAPGPVRPFAGAIEGQTCPYSP